jgi:hypothetical protein
LPPAPPAPPPPPAVKLLPFTHQDWPPGFP